MSETNNGLEVLKSIAEMTGEIATVGIGKDKKNQQQGFAYRGVDDFYEVLAPLLAKHQLCILPRVVSRTATEKTNKNGTLLFYVSVTVEYDFISAKDGSKVTTRMEGEAMDSGDKATGKACSYAYKNNATQVFSIPIEPALDPDAVSHTVQDNPAQQARMTINGQRFNTALESIRSGEYTIEKMRKNFDLSEDQQTVLADLEKELAAKVPS